MNKKKLILGSLIIMMIISATFITTGADQKYNKHVSVVFDDSGSMAFDVRWAHGNYALQTLVSVLDEGDILQIHYMNDSDKDITIAIEDKASVQNILATIRENSVPDLLGDGETPIESISVGLSKFATVSKDILKEDTVYDNWLVLITDGNEMTNTDGEGYVNYVEDSNFESGYRWVGVLDREIANRLSSSSLEFSTVILKIGDTSQDMLLSSDMVGSQLIYKSASVSDEHIGEKQIIENMNDIASLISGRYPITINSKIANEARITSDVPFSNFDILLQNSGSKVKEVLNAAGQPVDFEISYTELLSPDNQQIGNRLLESDSNLYGSAIRLTSTQEEALSEGEYTVVFDENIELAKLASYCYPYIQFGFNYYVNGMEVDTVYQEDMVSLEFIPVRGGTNEILENLPSDIRYNLEIKSGNQFLSFKENSLETNEFLIKDSILEGSLTAEIPDIWLWSLNVSETIPVAPEEERPEDRIFTLEVSQAEASVSYKNFENASAVYFTPYLNDERLSEEQMELAELNIVRIYSADGSLTHVDHELIKEGTVFSFTPVYDGFKPSMPSDTYTVEVRFSSNELEGVNEYAFSQVNYEVGDASFFIRYLKYISTMFVLLIIMVYLIGVVIKPKLDSKNHHLVKYYYDSIIDLDEPIRRETFPIKTKTINRLLIPYVSEKGESADLIIKAGRKSDHIYISKDCQKPGMFIGEFELKEASAGKRDLRLNVNQKLEIIVKDKLTSYVYEKK